MLSGRGVSCETCKEVRREGEDTPCDTCPGNLMEGNYDAVRYYNILASQQRYSMDGKPLGLDYNAVRFVFDIYGVEKRLEIFEKLRVMERVAVEVRSAGG